MLSCKGVSNESDTEDIMYGTASVCTGIQTALVKTVQNFSKSGSLNLKKVNNFNRVLRIFIVYRETAVIPSMRITNERDPESAVNPVTKPLYLVTKISNMQAFEYQRLSM